MLALLLSCGAPEPEPAPAPSMPATAPPAVAASEEPASRELGSVRIVATGDLLLHKAVQDAAGDDAEGYARLLAAVKPLIEPADIAFANLETPIAPKSGKPVAPLEFNTSPALLAALRSTGFDVVSFANNHVYDQGRAGLVETLDHLDESGLRWVGAGRTCDEASAAQVLEAGGLKVAFLGTSQLYNDRLNAGPTEACADTFDEDRLLARAREAKAAGADAVVLSVHWGVEYATAPTPAQVEVAHRLLDGGVDLILGHHPHVLAPIEVHHAPDGRVTVVAYSLGNFVSNQSAWYEPGLNPPAAANPRDGVVLSIRVVRREYGRAEKVARVELADLVAEPLWTLNDATTRGDARPDISVVPLRERLDQQEAALDAASGPAIATLGAEVDELRRRWRIVSKTVGEQFLPPRDPVPPRSAGAAR